MNTWRLVSQGLRHYRRTHLGVALGFAVASAVLVGALLVGDSVRGSLRERALARIGSADAVLPAGDRFFRDALAGEIEDEWAGSRTAPVLFVRGHASVDGGARRANNIDVLGVDERFFALAPGEGSGVEPLGAREVLLGAALAEQLGVEDGDSVLLRVEKPSALPRDMILATTEDANLGLRVKVREIVGDAEFGSFGLAAGALAPRNAMVSRQWLAEELELAGRANLMLVDAPASGPESGPELAQRANAALRARWQLDDGELVLATAAGGLELTTPRVFLDDATARAVVDMNRPATGVLTYFVNALESGDGATPYSMVSALGPLGASAASDELRAILPADLAADEVVVSDWLATDLAAGVGDEITVRYWVPGPDRRLVEESRTLRLRAVVPIEGLAADPGLMPAFPGLGDAENCRDWDTGFPVDLASIRDKDEEYWDEHQGTPKAFLELEAGRALWGNRFGSLTAIRVPTDSADDFAAELARTLDPASLGLAFRDLRGPAIAGSATATDFGGLFLALSFFLIASALLLTTLLFVFGVEQRGREIGTLLAVGFEPRQVRRLFLAEAAVLGAAGVVVGAALGVLYTRAVLAALSSVWSGAVASTPIEYHGSALTWIGGSAGAWVVALGATWQALRAQVRHSAVELLQSSEGVAPEAASAEPKKGRTALITAGVALAVAFGVGLATDPSGGPAAAGAFFGAGAALLVAGLALTRFWLGRGTPASVPKSVAALGRRNGARRPGRSLATVALLASGTFLVVSIGVHRRAGVVDAGARQSGTGGFALIGTSTLPVHHDLGSEDGRDAFGLSAQDLEGVSFVPLRVGVGDEGGCLNLGSPQAPRILGVDPDELAERGAFVFGATPDVGPGESPWASLARLGDDGAVPAIGDAASVTWSLKKSIGDTIDYVDERGRAFQVRIVGTVVDSILQGNLVVDERFFQERFPSQGGYRMFLIDAPADGAEAVSATLGRGLSEVGLELVPAAERLQEFRAVQNTYLDIFQLLGGLGVLLGSVGLGVVVLRNALERRRELATLAALGFTRASLRRLLFGEHGWLLVLGLGAGAAAALLALLPVDAAGSSGSPLMSGLPILALMVVNGVLWVAIASALAVRDDQLGALRNE